MIVTPYTAPATLHQTEATAKPADRKPPARSTSASGRLRLKLIGPMEATTADGDNVLPLGRKTRALLAILALSPRPVTRARLAELLWSQRSEEQGRSLLRQELHRLAEALLPVHEAILNPTRDRVAMNAEWVWVDVDEALRATAANPAGLALLDGLVLEGLDGIDPALDVWVAAERERIQDRARAVAEAVMHQSTTPQQTIAAAKQLLKLDRANEGGWRRLMLAYHALGDPQLALQSFAQCRAALAELLDALPSHGIQRLAADIGRGTADSAHPPTIYGRTEPAYHRSIGRHAWMGVLPLRAHSLRAAEADLPLDIATAIGAALARFSDFSVAPTDRLAQFGDRDETTLRQVFGLDLLLDGSVRRADSELQLDLRLLDLRAGNQVIWTHRFKAPLGESPLPHQELAAEIAAQIDPEILRIEGQRAAERTDGCGYDLVMRAIPLIARLHREEFCRAGAMLSEAIVADPTYGPARAWRAYWTKFAVSQQWIEDVEAAVDEAQLHAEQAILLDSRNARSLALASYALGYLTRRFPEARAVQARALELNPNLAMGWGLAALTSTSAGAFGDATAQFEQYRRLAPQDPNSFLYDAGMALHALLRGDTAEAVVLGRRACELNPQFTTALKIYLSALGHAGHIAEAEPVLARLRAIQPGFDIRTALYRSSLARPEDRELFTAGLVRACGW